MQTDELCEDPSAMEDYSRTAIPEEGFKGNFRFKIHEMHRPYLVLSILGFDVGTELLRS